MNQFEVRLSGSGGQGLILAGMILSEAVLLEGKRAAQSQSFEPVSRGGFSRSDVIISGERVEYPLATSLDVLLILDQQAVEESQPLVKPGGIIVVDSQRVPSPPASAARLYSLPMVETAVALGNIRSANMVSLGAIVALSGICKAESLESAVRARSPKGFLEVNIAALNEGHRLGAEAITTGAK